MVSSGQALGGALIAGSSVRTGALGQALLGITRNGALAIGRGDDLGRIAPGYHADFVVLPQSPFLIDAQALYAVAVQATYVAGECVYRAPANSTR